ncbi:MAG TPA: hypothetical protein VGE74_18280 [Gemmata sp.]
MAERATAPCPWCREPIDPRDRACPECGRGVAWCPACGTGNVPDAACCRQCKRSFLANDATEGLSLPQAVTIADDGPGGPIPVRQQAPAPQHATAPQQPAPLEPRAPAPPRGVQVTPDTVVADPAPVSGPRSNRVPPPDAPAPTTSGSPRAGGAELAQALGTIIPPDWAPRISSPLVSLTAPAPERAPVSPAGPPSQAGSGVAPQPPARPHPAPVGPYAAPLPVAAVYPDPTALGPSPVHLACVVCGANHPGESGTLQLTVAAPRATANLVVRLEVAGLLQPAPVSCTLSAGQEHFGPTVEFVAPRAGEHPVRVVATIARPDRRPLGRWGGSLNVRVVPVRTSPVNVKGDVIVMGADGTGALAGVLGQEVAPRPTGTADNRDVRLHADPGYAARLAASCPHIAAPYRPDEPPFNPGPVLLLVYDTETGHEARYAVAHGSTAVLGRGGQADPTWRVRPAPYDYTRHTRLTGEHVALGLQDGLAWVTDYSRNGTWLNRVRLRAATEEFLADKDELALLPDRAVVVRVRLAGDAHGVHTLAAHRVDRLNGQLTHLLTSGRAPVPVFWPGADAPALWVRWGRGAGRPVAVVAWADDRAEVPEGGAAGAGRFQVRWHPLAPRADERAVLAPVPGWPADRIPPPEERPDA